MSVPKHDDIPKKLHDTGLYDLRTKAGHDAFTDAVVTTLKGRDARWRHLKKRPDQTNIHGHGEDSALYLLDDGRALAVDFIIGAGGPNPKPGWGVGDHVYKHADGHDPDNHGIGASVPPPPAPYIPSYGELGDDAFFRAQIGVPLQEDMARVGQALNDGSSVWFSRTTYELLTEALKAGKMVDPAPIVRKYRNQWRAILGLPPI